MRINWWSYKRLAPGNAQPSRVKTLQCLLTVKHLYAGRIHGRYDAATVRAANRWQRRVGATPSETWTINNWVTLLSDGNTPVLKIGSGSYAVRRLQRTLNAALANHDVRATGVFGAETKRALRAWQGRAGLRRTGVAARNTWAALQR